MVPAVLALLLTACTATAFRSDYEAGRFDDAASAFRADSSLHDDEEALYRMAIMRAAPDSPVRDLTAARNTLQRLLELHPEGKRSHEAHVLLALLGDVRSLRTQLEELKAVDLGDETSDEPPR